VLAGESAYVIAVDWQARGIPTVRARVWESRKVTTLLSSPALAGDLTYHGEVVARDAFAAIIDRETLAEVRNRLAGQRGNAKRAPTLTGVLRGNVRCGLCGAPMYVHGGLDQFPCYSCICGRLQIDQRRLDAWITELVLERLEARRSRQGRLIWGRTDTDARIRVLNRESDRLLELNRRYFVTGDISYPEWIRARDDLTQDTGQRLVREHALRPPRGLPPSIPPWKVRTVWAELPVFVQREVLNIEINYVTIHKGKGVGSWDPTRIVPHWILPDPPPTLHHPTPHPSRRPNTPVTRHKAVAERLREQGGPFGVGDAAQVSGARIQTLHLLRRRGELAAELVRGRYLYRIEDLDRAFPPEDFDSYTIGRGEALEILDTTAGRLDRMRAVGALPYLQRGKLGHVWFRRRDLDALLQDPDHKRYLHTRRPPSAR
jgi:hypothetical protein